MAQTKRESVIEAITNIVIGMGVAYVSQVIVFPIVGIHNTAATTHLQITLWFTAISFVRSYLIRRYFTTHMGQLVRWIARGK